MAASPTPADGDVISLVDTLARLHQAELHCIEQEFGLTPLEVRLLRALDPAHPQAMARLSEAIGCNPANTTAVVDRLETRRLIERRSDPDDRRVKTIGITRKGETLRGQLCARATTPPPWLAGLSAKDRADLERVLRRIDQLATAAQCPRDEVS